MTRDIVSYSYDPAGYVTALTYPGGKTIAYSFDAAGRMASVTDWSGHTTHFSYDPTGNLVSQVDPNGVTSTSTYDQAGQLSSIADTNASSRLASFSYSRNGDGLLSTSNATGIVQPQPSQSYSYSAVQELIGVESASTTAKYSYDPADNLTGLPDGTSLSYNAASELTGGTRGSASTTFSFNANGNRVSQSGSGVGAQSCVLCLTSATGSGELSATGSAHVASAGAIAADSTAPDAVTATGSATIAGSEVFVAGGVKTTGKASVSSLAPPGSGIASNPFATLVAPIVSAPPQSVSVTGSASQSATPGLYSSMAVSGSGVLALAAGTYVVTGGLSATGSGKIEGSDVTIYLACSNYPAPCTSGTAGAGISVSGNASISVSGPATGQAATIEADPSNGASISAGGTGSIDLSGSLDVPSMSLGATGTATITVTSGVVAAASASATGTATVTVDGSTSSLPKIAYSYDGANRLTGYASAAIHASYSYNADNLRMSATTNGVVQSFTWDTITGQPKLLSDGTNYYVYGPSGVPIEQVSQSTGAARYLSTDQLGSVVLTTDSSGNIVGTDSYTAYGTLASLTGSAQSPFGFAGGYADPTALIYLVHRYYDPATGQFLSVDPKVNETGAPYSYVNGDPINVTDPPGCINPCASFAATIAADEAISKILSLGKSWAQQNCHPLAVTLADVLIGLKDAVALTLHITEAAECSKVVTDLWVSINDSIMNPGVDDAIQNAYIDFIANLEQNGRSMLTDSGIYL